jgi:hypothetical protein
MAAARNVRTKRGVEGQFIMMRALGDAGRDALCGIFVGRRRGNEGKGKLTPAP